ncbi:MAG: Eco57I restriction-modification methylase domain-containing protein [Deltaproteobacteria bacterium]|nr:Eco57I restriction-modification methylase domain-containing protein [Deltaproteobacteria bacterium]
MLKGPGPGDVHARSLPRASRRDRGIYYTPAFLVDYVVDETLGPLLPKLAFREDGSPRVRILDPAAGDGRFLTACVDRLVSAATQAGFAPERARTSIVRQCVVGVERDERAAALSRHALGTGADIRVGEALCGNAAPEGAWDVVIGNPPYVRSVALKRAEPALWQALRGKFLATSHGEWDLYTAFLERALAWTAPGGEIGLVVPSRWFTAKNAAPLRALLSQRRCVRKIVDFGARQVFEGATTYAALVFLTRREEGALAVEVTRWAGDVATPGGAPPPIPPRGEWAQGTIPSLALGRGPWILSVGRGENLIGRLRSAGPPLGQVARVSKGAGTNADSVFLIPASDGAALEEGALVPCVRGRDLAPFAPRVSRLALLPYDGDRPVPPGELAKRWPRAAAYLERHRAVLEARERGRFRGDLFYRWGRPQNLIWLRDPAPKVIVPDVARGGRAVLDDQGLLVIDTAYALRPMDPGGASHLLGLILAVLNSSIVGEWLRLAGIPLRGGYFRMKTAYLSSLPLPRVDTWGARSVAEWARRVRPEDEAERAALDRAVRGLYGVGSSVTAPSAPRAPRPARPVP